MNLKEMSVPGSLATWLIAIVLVLNLITTVAFGAMFVRMERADLRLESELCGAVELQRGWNELRAAQDALDAVE